MRWLGKLLHRTTLVAIAWAVVVGFNDADVFGQEPKPPVFDAKAPFGSTPIRLQCSAPSSTPDLINRDSGSAESKEQRFLIERIDAQRTLDVTVGRPVILRFRNAPFRDQVGAPAIAEVLNITETELSVTGKKVGSTVLNFWFKDPTGRTDQEVLSYLARVSEDPERSRQ